MIDTIIVSGGNIHSDFALDFLKKNEACLIAADKGLEFFLEHQLLPAETVFRPKQNAKVLLDVAACGHYEVYLNGEKKDRRSTRLNSSH